MTNMKKILLAPVILATSQIAMGGTGTDNLENLAGVENYGQIHIRGEQTITSADGQWLDNYGTITLYPKDGGKLTLASTDPNTSVNNNSGIKVHVQQEFVSLTGMEPKKLIEVIDAEGNSDIKNYYGTQEGKSYYSLTAEKGKLIVDDGENAPVELNDSNIGNYTNTEEITNRCITISDAKSAIVFENIDVGNGVMTPFLSQEDNNTVNNTLVLRGQTTGQEVPLRNSDAEAIINVKANIANDGGYFGEWTNSDPSKTLTLSKPQRLKVEGNFNFTAFNGLFNEGKVSFDAGKSTISSVASMFHSDIDVKSGAELELNPQCKYYNGSEEPKEEGIKTIRYNKTMNIANGGKLTVNGGKLIIGENGVLNLGAASGGGVITTDPEGGDEDSADDPNQDL